MEWKVDTSQTISSRIGKLPKSRIGVTAACDRCHAKKIRCDRGKPSCSKCARSKFDCKTTKRSPKKPSGKTYPKTLEERVESLEKELSGSNLDQKIDTLLKGYLNYAESWKEDISSLPQEGFLSSSWSNMEAFAQKDSSTCFSLSVTKVHVRPLMDFLGQKIPEEATFQIIKTARLTTLHIQWLTVTLYDYSSLYLAKWVYGPEADIQRIPSNMQAGAFFKFLNCYLQNTLTADFWSQGTLDPRAEINGNIQLALSMWPVQFGNLMMYDAQFLDDFQSGDMKI